MASPSNEFTRSASLCESGGTTRPHGLPCDVLGAEGAQMMKEPGACRYSTVLMKPQLWVEGEQAIAGCDETLHERAGIGRVNDASDVDPIPLESHVGFVSREQKLVFIADPGEGAAGNDLAGVPVVEAIAHGHLTEMQEAGEACIDHSEEQHVVVIT